MPPKGRFSIARRRATRPAAVAAPPPQEPRAATETNDQTLQRHGLGGTLLGELISAAVPPGTNLASEEHQRQLGETIGIVIGLTESPTTTLAVVAAALQQEEQFRGIGDLLHVAIEIHPTLAGYRGSTVLEQTSSMPPAVVEGLRAGIKAARSLDGMQVGRLDQQQVRRMGHGPVPPPTAPHL